MLATMCPWREGGGGGCKGQTHEYHRGSDLIWWLLERGQEMFHLNHGEFTASTGKLQIEIHEYTHTQIPTEAKARKLTG